MYCKCCGNELNINANFCSNCGYPLKHKNFMVIRFRRLGIWLMPVIIAILATFWLITFYAVQIKTSYDISKLCEQAESSGLDDKFDDALSIVSQGLTIRPNDKSLINDKIMLLHGKNISDHLNVAHNYLNNNNYKAAENEIQLAEGELGDFRGPLHDKLQKMILDKKTSAEVLKVKIQMNTNKNIDDLAVLLSDVEQYDTDEARDASSELRKYIGNVAYDQANECLKVRDFTAALDLVNEGLVYDISNDKLSSFKDTISMQKENFEKIEKESMEQAMESAAKEDSINKTAALNLIESNGQFNSSGDFVISGKVRNIATKAVSMVKVFYTIYNASGSIISDNSTYVFPNYINPGDTGDFESTEYGIPQGSYMKVTKTIWYIE